MSRLAGRLEARVPAPVVGALLGAAMWVAARVAEVSGDGSPLRIGAAIVLADASAVLAAVAALTIHRARTSIDPLHPERASRLITHGVFRFSRNPLYLSGALLLAAYALRLGEPAMALGPAAYVAYVTRFQIVPEERALSARFGDAYRAYLRRTRRWI